MAKRSARARSAAARKGWQTRRANSARKAQQQRERRQAREAARAEYASLDDWLDAYEADQFEDEPIEELTGALDYRRKK